MITKKFMKYSIIALCFMTMFMVAITGCKDTKETDGVSLTQETEESSLDVVSDERNETVMYTTEDVNVRFAPDINSDIFTTIPAGTRIVVYDYVDGDEWGKTILFGEESYYIRSEFLSTTEVVEDETAEEETTSEPLDGEGDYTMYTTSRLNVRYSPGMNGEILTTLGVGAAVTVHTKGSTTEWYLITSGDVNGYVNSSYLSNEQKVTTSTGTEIDPAVFSQDIATWSYVERCSGVTKNVVASEFHYYGIYSGAGWKFAPEQIDDAWRYVANGEVKYRPNKPHMEAGTTRAWQAYLYQKLQEKGLGWYYKIAVAQAMQESGFNPHNAASIDHGLFSFRKTFWNSAYGDIYDYHANIDAYVDRVDRYLTGADSIQDIYLAISQHFNPDGQIHMGYVNYVLSHLEELWEFD